MPNYRRIWRKGGTYFFTITLLNRHQNTLLTDNIDLLRRVVAQVRTRYPFIIHGWVALPEHLHCVIELPEGDADFAIRWRLVKMRFSAQIPRTETIDPTRKKTRRTRHLATPLLGAPHPR